MKWISQFIHFMDCFLFHNSTIKEKRKNWRTFDLINESNQYYTSNLMNEWSKIKIKLFIFDLLNEWINPRWRGKEEAINNQFNLHKEKIDWLSWFAGFVGGCNQMNSISFQFLQLCEEMKEMNEFELLCRPWAHNKFNQIKSNNSIKFI